MWTRWILGVLLILAADSSAHAELRVIDSIEWVTCQAEVVVVGRVVRAERKATDKGLHYDTVALEVEELIKGTAGPKQLTYVDRSHASDSAPLPKPGLHVLAFLSAYKPTGGRRPDARLADKLIPGWISAQGMAVLPLADLPKELFSKSLKQIQTGPELLEIVRTWARSPIRHSLELDGDEKTDLLAYVGQATRVVVPAEESHRARLIKLARSKGSGRADAVRELYKFPGQETERVLWELTKDMTTAQSSYAQDIISEVAYPVREAAFRSLQRLHGSSPLVEIRRPPTTEERRTLRQRVWSDSFGSALPAGWRVHHVRDLQTTVQPGCSWPLTGVRVTVVSEAGEHVFELHPKEWPEAQPAASRYLGVDGPHSQGGRRFYVGKGAPSDLVEPVVRYFGLVKPAPARPEPAGATQVKR